MKTKNIKLEYLEQFNAFGVADEVIEALMAHGITPILSLKEEDYCRLDCPAPAKNAPKVAFLLGREEGYYTIDFSYAKAVTQSGVRMRFMTYHENVLQIEGTDALILPGGMFPMFKEFYSDPENLDGSQPGSRAYAYLTSVMEAEKRKLPMLGICAGAQVIGSMHSMKMFHRLDKVTSKEHKTKEMHAHDVVIKKDSLLYDIIGQETLVVNSRHVEGMAPTDKGSDLTIYANARDGVPEAWGNKEKNILCIQWHPENYAAAGDKTMQGIYNWLAGRARIYQKQKQMMFRKIKVQSIASSLLQKRNTH